MDSNEMIKRECDEPDEIPIDKLKRLTNFKSLISFSIFMVLYLILAVIAFIYGNAVEDQQAVARHFFMSTPLDVIVFFCIALVTAVLQLLVIRAISRALIIIFIILEIIVVLFAMWAIISTTLNKNNFLIIFIIAGFYFWEFSVYLFALSRIGTKIISEIIRESLRAITASVPLIIFTVLMSTLLFMVLMLIPLIHTKLKMLKNVYPGSFCLESFQYINEISGFWLIFFLFRFTEMVCYRVFSIWFYTVDKSSFSLHTIKQCIKLVFRYHLGTVAYAPFFLYIFPLACTMIKSLVNKAREIRYNIFVLIPCYLTTFWTLNDYSYIVSAMQGKSFKKSADKACQLCLKHPLQIYTIWQVLIRWFMIHIVLYCYFYFSIVQSLFDFTPNFDEPPNWFSTVTNLSYDFYFISLLPGFILITTSVKVITSCILQNHDYEKRNNIITGFFNPKLQGFVLTE